MEPQNSKGDTSISANLYHSPTRPRVVREQAQHLSMGTGCHLQSPKWTPCLPSSACHCWCPRGQGSDSCRRQPALTEVMRSLSSVKTGMPAPSHCSPGGVHIRHRRYVDLELKGGRRSEAQLALGVRGTLLQRRVILEMNHLV